MMPDSRMLLQAPCDALENSDGFVVRCPAALSVSIAVGAALSLVPVEEYCRQALIEKLLADGLAVDVTLETSSGACH